jgi:ribosomal protein S18 acetylase RimI-like enzyme
MNRDLVADVNDNYAHAFSVLASQTPDGEVREFGSLTATSSRVPIPFFNQVFVFDRPDEHDLAAAVSWLAERGDPFTVTVPEPLSGAVAAHSDDLGIALEGRQPGMAMPIEDLSPRRSAVDIVPVTDGADLQTFAVVSAEAFGMPLDISRQLASKAALERADMSFLLGSVDGEAVASGILIHSGDVAGVYTIGVLESHRRRGVGEAMTWAVVREGQAEGCRVATLQSSEMGLSVYERMGFETVVEYCQFHPVA